MAMTIQKKLPRSTLKSLGHSLLCGGLNAAKCHATARGLQLPICSIDQRGQQPIAVQQVLDGYGKPNETVEASLNVM